jgi:hypothetical protein
LTISTSKKNPSFNNLFKKNNEIKNSKNIQLHQLNTFLKEATPAQKFQIDMIKQVFLMMDLDEDGVLTFGDVKAYFKSMGRNSNDLEVRKWINSKDIDQDGAVSFSEFVASYSMQFDPRSKFFARDGTLISNQENNVSLISAAFGAVRLGSTIRECCMACDTAEYFIRRILDSPSVQSFWRISIREELFHSKVGRLFGGIKLMTALGFRLENNASVLALQDINGKEWISVPNEIRKDLVSRLDELKCHQSSLFEPSISNIAAGIQNFILFILNKC